MREQSVRDAEAAGREAGNTAQGDSQSHLLQRPEDVERRLVALPTRPRRQDTGSVTLTRLQGVAPGLPRCRQRPSPRHAASDAHTRARGEASLTLSPQQSPHLYSAHLCPSLTREIPFLSPRQADPCSHPLPKGERNASCPHPQSCRLREGPSRRSPHLPLPPTAWAMVHAAVYAVSVSFLFFIFLVGRLGWVAVGNGEEGVGTPRWGRRDSHVLTPCSPLPFLPPPRQ